MIPKLEFIKRDVVEIKNLFTYRHHDNGGFIKDYKYAGFMKEMVDYPDKRLEEYAYYKDKLKTYNSDIKGNYRPEHARFYTNRTREIIKDIQTNGYKEVKEYVINEAGRPRPAVAGLVEEGSDTIEILNGHHRCSIMYALGHKTIPMMLFKLAEEKK